MDTQKAAAFCMKKDDFRQDLRGGYEAVRGRKKKLLPVRVIVECFSVLDLTAKVQPPSTLQLCIIPTRRTL